MIREFELLLRDYNSSCVPSPNDPKTIETLDTIAVSIYNGIYEEEDFLSFVNNNLGNGSFAAMCKKHVLQLIRPQSK